MKYSCFQDCSVVCLLRFLLTNAPLVKVIGNRFWMTSFSNMSLLTCPCLRGKRVEKSQAILEHLMTFGSNSFTGKPEQFCL